MRIHLSPNLLLHLKELAIVPVIIVFILFVTAVPFHAELVDIRLMTVNPLDAVFSNHQLLIVGSCFRPGVKSKLLERRTKSGIKVTSLVHSGGYLGL